MVLGEFCKTLCTLTLGHANWRRTKAEYLLNSSYHSLTVYSPLRMHTPQFLNKYCPSILPMCLWSHLGKWLPLPLKHLFPYVHLPLDTFTLFLSTHHIVLAISGDVHLSNCLSSKPISPYSLASSSSYASFANIVCSKANPLPLPPPYYNRFCFQWKKMIDPSLLSILLENCCPFVWLHGTISFSSFTTVTCHCPPTFSCFLPVPFTTTLFNF